MHSRQPDLTAAMSEMLDRIDRILAEGNYTGDPIQMYLAGGMAMHYHCGSRYTQDVDASFSHRLLLPADELIIDYQREDGTETALYFDANYNDSFALMHPDYQENSQPWEGIGNQERKIHLRVLTPLDLAVSKVSRFSDQDHEDIILLAANRFFSAPELVAQSREALGYYVGDPRWIHLTLDRLEEEITFLQPE